MSTRDRFSGSNGIEQEHDGGEKQNVLIYRRDLLPYSETFIPEQGEALVGFTPYYVGFRRVNDCALPPERLRLLSDGGLLGRARLANFRLTQWDPVWMASLRRLRPALIHAHFEWGGKDAVPLARALRIPLMVTCHGTDVTDSGATPFGSKNPLGPWLHAARRRRLLAEGRLFLAASNFIRQKMLGRGYPEDQTMVHYIGVDTAKFCPPPPDPPLREPLVVFVGRLIEVKGCEYLLRAMAELPAALGKIRVAIIGDGPLRASLEALARERGVRACEFLGRQSPEQVRGWLARARVFCVPSITSPSGVAEGLGMVFCEAQAMGVPCVSFYCGGIPEVVCHGETGLLCKERDWRGLADYLARLFLDDAQWQSMSRAARERMTGQFDLPTQTRALERHYEALTTRAREVRGMRHEK